MWSNHKGVIAFYCGTIVMFIAVILGNTIQAEVSTIGIDAYTAQHGFIGWVKFLLFAFGFPLGIGIAAIGVMLASGTTWGRLFWFSILVALGSLTTLLIPLLLGRDASATFFGTGGYVILLLIVISFWFWGAHRAKLPQVAHLATDLQGAGYLCFAMVAWNLCGVGGMPSFSLDPERMMALVTQQFAIGQMKSVMVLIILGWLFTLLGYRKAAQIETHH